MHQGVASTTRRRGHQHHPRHATRRRLDASSRGPAQCGPAEVKTDKSLDLSVDDDKPLLTSSTSRDKDCRSTAEEESPELIDSVDLQLEKYDDSHGTKSTTVGQQLIETQIVTADDCKQHSENVVQRPARCGQDDDLDFDSDYDGFKSNRIKSKNVEKRLIVGRNNNDKTNKNRRGSPRHSRIDNNRSPEPEHAVARARGDGNSDDETNTVEEDPELAELAKMRCPSERTEVQAEKEARRRKRCADYPGLAFGCSIFSSDTMMKFSLIKNELQNIMGNQLKRVSIEGKESSAKVDVHDFFFRWPPSSS